MIMNTMNITSAQYANSPFTGQPSSIKATIDGTEWSVPLVAGNRHYDEIMRQVEAGTLVIQEAETEQTQVE
jgi:pyridoxal biosynthesis lyase PdxS